MSGWDKPNRGDESDDGWGGRGGRFDEDRPFPVAPREERGLFRRDWPEAEEDRLFPGAPENREPVQAPTDTPSMDDLRAIYAEAKSSGDIEAAWKEDQARRKQDQPPGPEGTEQAGQRPGADADTSSGKDSSGLVEDSDEPQSVQAEGAPNRSREQIQESEKAQSPDSPEAADKGAERIQELEAELEETKGELAQTKSELAEERADRRKLTGVVAGQADEIKRLKEQLEARDRPAEDASAVDATPGMNSDKAVEEQAAKPESPWYRKLPSEKLVGIATTGATAIETVGVATHTMSGTTESIIGGFMTLGVAILAYGHERREKKDETNG